jgi:hypothetical protein
MTRKLNTVEIHSCTKLRLQLRCKSLSFNKMPTNVVNTSIQLQTLKTGILWPQLWLQLRYKPLLKIKCRQMRQMDASSVVVYILPFVCINMNYMYIPPPRSRVELAETMRQASLSHIL